MRCSKVNYYGGGKQCCSKENEFRSQSPVTQYKEMMARSESMHPKLAGGIFCLLYGILGLIIEKIFKISLFDNIIFYVILIILGFIVYMYFAKRYDGDGNV